MKNQLQNDIWLYGVLVVTLGLTVVASILETIVLAMSGQSTPAVLVALGSATTGGLLAPSPLNR